MTAEVPAHNALHVKAFLAADEICANDEIDSACPMS
jgi:hypothetical protein